MRILWSVNTILPDVAKSFDFKFGHAISWVDAMRTALVEEHKDIQLTIVCNGDAQVSKLEKKEYNSVIYYIIPDKYNCEMYWEQIIDEVSPDVIHIYGTERNHNLSLIDKYNEKIPIIISLQGILSEYHRHYYGCIPMKDIIRNYTLYDVLSRNGIISKKNAFRKQAEREKEMFSKVYFVEGRSDWDKAVSLNINSNLKYYYCPRMIRKPFFDYQWNESKVEKHSLFVHQGNYPIKGLHFMLDALDIISKKYPDVKLYVSGNSIFEGSRIKEKGYTKYLKKKIVDYKLKDKIVFTGHLSAEKLAKKLSEVNVCVVPSAIENAPNALAEAMIVGTPCIASYVGGNAEMLKYGELGLLYCYYEPQLLAERIERLFEEKDIIEELSEKAFHHARNKHNPETLVQKLLNIYKDAINTFEKMSEEKIENEHNICY